MSSSLLPADLASLRKAAAAGYTHARVLLHLLERVEALEQLHQDKLDRLIALDRGDDEPTPEAAHPSHGNSEYTDQEWAEIKRWRQQPPASQPAPPAAPAGGLLERVCGEMTGDDDPSIDARAAIREVAEWLDQQGQHGCSLLLREEAGR